MPNDITLTGHFVEQGNGNGKLLESGSDDVLYTADLIDCVAILVVDDRNCYLIHSDTNNASGKGSISLADGFKELGLSKEKHYKIGLAGGNSENALTAKQAAIQQILPHIEVVYSKAMVDGAYLTGHGVMAHSKRALAEKLEVDSIQLEGPPQMEGDMEGESSPEGCDIDCLSHLSKP